jgi:hypothetical protein
LDFDWKWPLTALQPLHSHEDGHRLLFFWQMYPWLSELSHHLCIDALGDESSWNRFLKARWTLVHEFVFEYSITQKLFSTEDANSKNWEPWR